MLRVLSSEIDLYPGSQEERLPGFSAQFPHITSYALLPDDPAQGCIWHWHKSLELFRVEQGALLYHTPGGQRLFRAGSGGIINSNVLHRTQSLEPGTAMKIHQFEPAFIAGIPGGTIEQRYVAPLVGPAGRNCWPFPRRTLHRPPFWPCWKKALRWMRPPLDMNCGCRRFSPSSGC